MTTKTDIVIAGAGIAGLWLFNRLKREGYSVLLLEKESIGCGQTVASQGIIHSGLKYAFAGQVNALARSISAMPDLWRAALRGDGPVDLSAAKVNASSQYLLIPPGFMGGLIGLVAKKTLGGNVHELPAARWPQALRQTGFSGTVIFMDEPVLDVASALHALAAPYPGAIRKADILSDAEFVIGAGGAIDNLNLGGQTITAKRYIFTAAGANRMLAEKLGHAAGLETQARPLLMGLMHNAPCELYAHCVGPSDKPVMTITTHRTADGSLVWYLGGGVAERAKDSRPGDVYRAAQEALGKYIPGIDLSRVQWSTLPIDRIEGKSATSGHLPDTPVIHAAANALYCWPTKLTFAPMLAEKILEKFAAEGIGPSAPQPDWSFLSPCPFTQTPWDTARWTAAASA